MPLKAMGPVDSWQWQTWCVSSQLRDAAFTNCGSQTACSGCVSVVLHWCRPQYLHTLCNALVLVTETLCLLVIITDTIYPQCRWQYFG